MSLHALKQPNRDSLIWIRGKYSVAMYMYTVFDSNMLQYVPSTLGLNKASTVLIPNRYRNPTFQICNFQMC